jgi:hypothetical protein
MTSMHRSRVEPSQLAWDVTRIRKDFPLLEQTVHGRPLIYSTPSWRAAWCSMSCSTSPCMRRCARSRLASSDQSWTD